ncbi:hypothetical protein [Flagellimonas meishanensis]|uniref:hypothetical protein n=1 Tax=Flagellimonas meishanensis TaxID=2873264 RepID=UPI001CA6AF2F|nr:hypothetical protein [[Muricauda] meishanensis]
MNLDHIIFEGIQLHFYRYKKNTPIILGVCDYINHFFNHLINFLWDATDFVALFGVNGDFYYKSVIKQTKSGNKIEKYN